MTKSLTKSLQLFVAFVILSVTIFSCSSQKKIKYFQDIPDSGKLKTITSAQYVEPTIQVNDVINVTIQTIDPLSTTMINSANITSGGSSSMPSTSGGASGLLASIAGGASSNPQQANSGYLVNAGGNIEIPIIGTVKAAGLTTAALRDTVYNRSLKYYIKPTVTVNFVNFKVNVTGEVLKPGQYVMPYEKVTIFDALALAGDLTIFGKRENVLLVRTNEDGTKTPYRINLKKSDIMSEPYFYLRQNDFIYVEPRKAKSDATDASQAKYFALAGSILSILIIFATRRN